MMVKTYDTTSEHKREWIRQVNNDIKSVRNKNLKLISVFLVCYLNKWARMVISIEQIVDTKEKLKQQRRYSHFLSNGEKALIVRWRQTVICFFVLFFH